MDKFKYLFKNMGFMFIGSFSSKILVFLLVPIYTNVLSTSEYGCYDLMYTTIQLATPILTLNIVDGILRFAIDAPLDKQKSIFTMSLKYIFISSVLLLSFSLISIVVFKFELLKTYLFEFMLLYLAYLFNQMMIQFSRAIDDVKGTSIAGIIGTVTMVSLNILFLLVFKFGLIGYFYANIIGLTLPTLFLFVRNKLHTFISLKILNMYKQLEREVVAYCTPLIFTTLSWTVNNLADRYVVTWFCGIDANGIYSVSYKIPAILNSIQSIFIQAWQLSAIKELDSKDGSAFFNQTYQGCHTVMVVLTSGVILFTKFLAKILFAKDFYSAWEFVPILLLYVLFNTLSGTIGGVFTAAKDSEAFAKSAITGVSVNIFLNFILVYYMGTMGAALATVISSVVIWIMRYIYSKKHIVWTVNLKRHYLDFGLLLIQACIMMTVNSYYSYVIQLIIMIVIFYNNFVTLKKFLKRG